MKDNKNALVNESEKTYNPIVPQNCGHVKLSRSILEWEWYSDRNVFRLFIHCLLKANWQPKKWKGLEIHAGQFVTSLNHLAKETGLSLQQLRSALGKLKSTHEITHKATNHNSIITINNWDKWQTNQQTNQHLNNIPITTTKERKENIYRDSKNFLINLSKEKNLNQDWINLISDWLDYKKGLNHSYKTEQSLSAFIQKLLNLSNNNIEVATAIINESMANNWKGIFSLKNKLQIQEGGTDEYNPNL